MEKEIKVEYLCSQPFWNFSGSEKAKFCKVCKHHLHDFSNMELEEIKTTLKNSAGRTCGTFYRDQFIIDERTRRSPAMHRLIYASAITFLSATFSGKAQEKINDPVKTEQHYAEPDQEKKISVESIIVSECPAVANKDADESIITKRKSRGLKLFRFGGQTFYLSGRFPFVRSYRRSIGRVKF